MSSERIEQGKTYSQMNGNTVVRVVRVIEVGDTQSNVLALFGPLKGQRYDIANANLAARR